MATPDAQTCVSFELEGCLDASIHVHFKYAHVDQLIIFNLKSINSISGHKQPQCNLKVLLIFEKHVKTHVFWDFMATFDSKIIDASVED